jgi:hypothetical protein
MYIVKNTTISRHNKHSNIHVYVNTHTRIRTRTHLFIDNPIFNGLVATAHVLCVLHARASVRARFMMLVLKTTAYHPAITTAISTCTIHFNLLMRLQLYI